MTCGNCHPHSSWRLCFQRSPSLLASQCLHGKEKKGIALHQKQTHHLLRLFKWITCGHRVKSLPIQLDGREVYINRKSALKFLKLNSGLLGIDQLLSIRDISKAILSILSNQELVSERVWILTAFPPSDQSSELISKMTENLLSLIFGYLSPSELLAAGLVNRHWRTISYLTWDRHKPSWFPAMVSYSANNWCDERKGMDRLASGHPWSIDPKIDLGPLVKKLRGIILGQHGNWFLTRSENTQLWQWDGKPVKMGDPVPIRSWSSYALSTDERYLAFGTLQGDIWCYDLKNKNHQHYKFGGRAVRCMAFCPGRDKLNFFDDGNWYHLDLGSGETSLIQTKAFVCCYHFSPNGRVAASTSGSLPVNAECKLWSNLDEKLGNSRSLSQGCFDSFSFSKDGSLLAAIELSKCLIHVWDTRTEKLIIILDKKVNQCCLSPDGRFVVAVNLGVNKDHLHYQVYDLKKNRWAPLYSSEVNPAICSMGTLLPFVRFDPSGLSLSLLAGHGWHVLHFAELHTT